jgi:tricorn protease interacting factor F2/3
MDDLRYHLALDLRSDSLEYSGRVEISARALPSSLGLDTVGHAIRSVTAGGRPLPFQHEPDRGRLTIPNIPGGSGSVAIEYTGTVDDRGVRGFYVSPMGSGRVLTTYFEPASARRFLPCVDRPDAKATFVVEVTAPSAMSVISNTAAEASDPLPDGRRRTRFAPTPPMSTYLLYVGIGPFEEIEGPRKAPRVILAASPGRAEGGRFAVDVASRAVDFFTAYYSEPYPLSKLHLIAVPQFGTGAMENWGAITFQEFVVLLEEPPAVSAKIRLVEYVSHEVAHQWFGNLVTMRWWNDLWLNEAFASFVAAKAGEALYPEGSAWDDFLNLRYASSMLWDALPHTHPVRVDVTEPEQIRQIFDEISYGKGASVLRMAEAYVGEETFRRAVSRYLADHRWGNAEAGDLWRAVAETSHEPVERVFSEWVGRPGFPVVRARREGRELHLDQRRFALLGAEDDPPWPIPLTVRIGGTLHRELFDRERTVVPVPEGVPVVNPGRSGYYRVRYEGALREQLLAGFPELPPVDRWGLVNDSLAFFLAGATDLDEYLEVFGRLETDRDPFVVSEVIATCRSLFPLIHRVPRWERELRRVVVAQSDRLGLERLPGEPERIRALREAMVLARVRLDPPFAASLAAMYPRIDSLDPELVRAVLTAAGATAGPEEYAGLRARLSAAPSVEAKRNIAGALGAVGRDEWIREGLEMILSGELLLGPWIDLFGSALVFNPERSGAVWSFLVDRSDDLVRLAAGTSNSGTLLQNAIPFLGLPRPAEMHEWLAHRSFPEAGRAVAKGLDLLELYLRVLERSR